MRRIAKYLSAHHRWIPARACLQTLAAAFALGLVIFTARILDGSLSPKSDVPEIDGAGWREWLTDVGVNGGSFRASLWASGEVARPEPEPVVQPGDSADPVRFVRVDVTGYCSRVEETDADPLITAMCTVTGSGVIALSRDLLRTFTPGAPFDFGDKVLLPGAGIFTIEDTMHPRWQRRADIWFPTVDEAYAWGRRVGFLTRVDGSTPLFPPEADVAQLIQPE
jgi:3D (Asp-Asp-Asp) domain-containing protein